MNFYRSLREYFRAHKIQGIMMLLVIVYFVYKIYSSITNTSGEIKYITSPATRETIITSITGSGQVSALNQYDLKPKGSGDVIYLGVKGGQVVTRGQLILELNAKDAKKTVRDAEAGLESAKISLAKILQPADALSILQAENALTNAKQSQNRANDNLVKSYDDAFTAISNSFIDLPTIITGLQDILYSYTNNAGQDNISYYTDLVKNYDAAIDLYKTNAADAYARARTAYDKNFLDYKSTSHYSDKQTIESLLTETQATTKAMAESVKSTGDFLNFVKDRLTERNKSIPGGLTANQTSLGTYTDKTNSSLSSLSSSITTIRNTKDDISNAELTTQEKTESLTKLRAGSDALDIQSSQLSLKQKENALQDAKDNLANYYVYAPFDGTIAKINVKTSDSVSSGNVAATLVTKQKYAIISLNEVDVSKIKIGEKATITFDAIDGLSMAGKVEAIDTIGTVSQGVVTYSVSISFDTDDDRIKPGMSVSTAIITDVKTNVLAVPNSAIKNRGDVSYVELFETEMAKGSDGQGTASKTAPQEQQIEVGLTNDTLTEIVSGLKEGDNVVTRTTTPSTVKTTTTPSLLNTIGGNRGGGLGGGATRALGR